MLSGKTIFITGGAGFIGSTLAGRLLADNRVIVYDNLSRNALQHTGFADHPNLTLVKGDILDYPTLHDAIAGATHVVHCAAIAGIVLKLKYPGRFDRLSVGLYLAMGWSGLMLYEAVVAALPALALGFVVAGGIFYTLGVAFHAWQRLRFQNAIWHGFVLSGAACHYTAVLDIVLK